MGDALFLHQKLSLLDFVSLAACLEIPLQFYSRLNAFHKVA